MKLSKIKTTERMYEEETGSLYIRVMYQNEDEIFWFKLKTSKVITKDIDILLEDNWEEMEAQETEKLEKEYQKK